MAFLDKAAFVAILMATSMAGVAAYAADLPEAQVEQQQIYSPTSAISWTGFYAGINGGFGSGSAPSSTGTAFNISPSGGFLGAQIGYNHHLTDNIVLGIEADADWANMTGRNPTGGPTVTETINWFGTVRGRLGYAMDTWLPYVTAGLAVAGATRTTTVGSGQSIGATHTGYVLGAGIEWAFAGDWSAKLEYQHLSLGAVTYSFSGPPPASVSLTADTIRIGLNKHF
jgi:outer membrane immunogenic protein